MTKKIVVFGILLTIGMISVFSGCDNLEPEVRWDSYENRFIHMNYPAQWTYEEVNNEGLIAVRFEEEGEDFAFELSIIGMENWLTEAEKLQRMEESALQLSEKEGFEILENTEVDISGHTGLKIVDQKEDRGIRQTVAAVFNYHQLAINFSGTEEAYSEHEKLVKETLDSIQIIINP